MKLLRYVGSGLLTGAGFIFLLVCGLLAFMIPSIALKEPRPFVATCGMLVLFCFPTGVIGYYFAQWAQAWRSRDPWRESLSRKAARALGLAWIAVAFLDVCRATRPMISISLIVLALWLGGSFYYLRYLDGWSHIPPLVRQRITNTIGFWVYGVLHAMAWVLVNALWLLVTGGRGGLVHFGGGRSGGAGASQDWH